MLVICICIQDSCVRTIRTDMYTDLCNKVHIYIGYRYLMIDFAQSLQTTLEYSAGASPSSREVRAALKATTLIIL